MLVFGSVLGGFLGFLDLVFGEDLGFWRFIFCVWLITVLVTCDVENIMKGVWELLWMKGCYLVWFFICFILIWFSPFRM